MPFKSKKQRKWMHANKPKMAKKWENESVVSLQENPAAIAAAQAMTRIKMQDPKTGKKVGATSALKNPEHPNHKKAKSMFDKLKDRFSKKKKEPEKQKQQSKSDSDFYKRQFGHKEESIIEINGVKYAPVEEGFGGELKGKDKEKFEKARKENAEVLGYKLTGKSDIREGQKRDANNLTVEFSKSFQRFTVAVNGLAKSMTKISGIPSDQKIIMNAFKKQVIPFIQLVDSWNKGQQKNPHLKESVNEAKSKTMTTIGSIIGKKQAQKISGVLVDMQTALVIMKVWNALNSSNRKKFEKLPIKQMANVAWKLVK